jgi:hypothetical protein
MQRVQRKRFHRTLHGHNRLRCYQTAEQTFFAADTTLACPAHEDVGTLGLEIEAGKKFLKSVAHEPARIA